MIPALPFFALPARALWRVTGEDRVRYLNGQVTQDLTLLKPGHGLYGAVLTGKGKIVGDLFVSATNDALWLDADLSLRETLRERLEKFLIADDAEIADVTEAFTLSRLLGSDLSPSISTPPGASGFAPAAFLTHRFGVPGVDYWVPGAGDGSQSFPMAARAGTEAEEEVARLEIERGIPRWGIEIDAETLPQEVALETDRRGLSYEKGCYVGQETVARVRSIGHVNRRLAKLEQVSGPADLAPGPLLSPAGEDAGRITRLAAFPDGKVRGLGFLKRKFFEGTPELRAGERTFRAILC